MARIPSRSAIDRVQKAVYPSFAFLAGMQLDLFSVLAAGPMSAGDIARALKVREEKLAPLLYALAAAGFLLARNGSFQNSKVAETYLVRKSPHFVGSYQMLPDIWTAAMKTSATIREGRPVAAHDFSTMTRSECDAFFRALDSEARSGARDLSRRFDFSDRRSLLDIGGGSGGLSVAMAERWPRLRATVMDLPNIVPITRRFVRTSSVSRRVKVIAHDITQKGPDRRLYNAFDVAVMRAVIQVLGPDQARRAIAQVGKMLKPGSPLYISGMGVLNDDRLSPREAVFFNLVFLNIYESGRAHTVSEYRAWLKGAGFTEVRSILRSDGGRILSARKG